MHFANVIERLKTTNKIYMESKNMKHEETKKVEVYYERI
jgi:hypothetical protein